MAVVTTWRERLGEIFKVDELVSDGLILKDNLAFKSPLVADLWDAWGKAVRDPDTALPGFIRKGAPLGMELEIPSSNGVFPPVALHMLQKLASPSPSLNYVAAEISLLLEDFKIPRLVLHHIPGVLNVGTDWLSRMRDRGARPASLDKVPIKTLEPLKVEQSQLQETTQDVPEKVITIRETVDVELAEKLSATVTKIQQVENRVTSLEKTQDQDMMMSERNRNPLWAISRSRTEKLLHVVKQASWNLPLQEWSTGCGWKFARRNVKVELTRYPSSTTRKCSKCQEMEQLRDKVKCGVELAQLVEI